MQNGFKWLAAASILALVASSAYAGEGLGSGGCSWGHTAQLVEVEKEAVSISTFDGTHLNLSEGGVEAVAHINECADGDIECQSASTEADD